MANYDGVGMRKRPRADPNLGLLEMYAEWHGVSITDLVRTYPKARSAREIAMFETEKIESAVESMALNGEIVWKYNILENGKLQETSAREIAKRVFGLVVSTTAFTHAEHADQLKMGELQTELEAKVDEHLENAFGIPKNSAAYNLITYWVDLKRFMHDSTPKSQTL